MRVFSTWSERRDSNPRPRPWQGRALPTELLSHIFIASGRFRMGGKNKEISSSVKKIDLKMSIS